MDSLRLLIKSGGERYSISDASELIYRKLSAGGGNLSVETPPVERSASALDDNAFDHGKSDDEIPDWPGKKKKDVLTHCGCSRSGSCGPENVARRRGRGDEVIKDRRGLRLSPGSV